MSNQDPFKMYSVFIGHLHPDVTKEEVRKLFCKVGDVQDLFIQQNENMSGYNYGFVRYNDMECALRAVEDFHKWPLRGTKLVVDVAKDTVTRIQKDGSNPLARPVDKKASRTVDKAKRKSSINNGYIKQSDFVGDLMYLSRMKEMVTHLKFLENPGKEGSNSKLDLDQLLEDIANNKKCREEKKQGYLTKDGTADRVQSLLLDSDDSDSEHGKERARDFKETLGKVLSSLSSFLHKNGYCINAINSLLPNGEGEESVRGDEHVMKERRRHSSFDSDSMVDTGNVFVEDANGSPILIKKRDQSSESIVAIQQNVSEISDRGTLESSTEDFRRLREQMEGQISEGDASDDSGMCSGYGNGRGCKEGSTSSGIYDEEEQTRRQSNIMNDSVRKESPHESSSGSDVSEQTSDPCTGHVSGQVSGQITGQDTEDRKVLLCCRSVSLSDTTRYQESLKTKEEAARNKSKELFKKLFFEQLTLDSQEGQSGDQKTDTSTTTPETSSNLERTTRTGKITKSVSYPEVRKAKCPSALMMNSSAPFKQNLIDSNAGGSIDENKVPISSILQGLIGRGRGIVNTPHNQNDRTASTTHSIKYIGRGQLIGLQAKHNGKP